MTIILSPCERVRERVDLGGLEDKRSGRQAIICGQSQRKNKYLPLLGKVRMCFKQFQPHPCPLLVKERGNNSPKCIYRLKKCAFTLAEVLITLGIIGVVAAMTMPSLIQRHREKVIVSQLKKSYSTLQQAYLMTVNELGTPDQWTLKDDLQTDNDDVDDSNNLLYYMKDYLKITKYCGGKALGCWANTYSLKGSAFQSHESLNRYSKAILADGESILTYVMSPDCSSSNGAIHNICGFFRVDVNGPKQPNQMGKDVFSFYIAKDRIVPAGSASEPDYYIYNFNNSCRDASSQEGRGCTAWVIYNENMDYLHCSDLSWDGKKTCSGK